MALNKKYTLKEVCISVGREITYFSDTEEPELIKNKILGFREDKIFDNSLIIEIDYCDYFQYIYIEDIIDIPFIDELRTKPIYKLIV